MEDFTLKDIMECAFTILEEENVVKYTKKYNREYLIEGFSQKEILPHWKWFGFSNNQSLGQQLVRIFGKKNNTRPWFYHFLYIAGYKQCSTCDNIKTLDYFCNLDTSIDNFNGTCKECDNKRSKAYRENNTEKCREAIRKHYNKNKEKYLAKNAKRRAAKLKAIPSWVGEKELKDITAFYKNCPKDYHVDHIEPIQGNNVCGLHCLDNLQYLSAYDNLSKGNRQI